MQIQSTYMQKSNVKFSFPTPPPPPPTLPLNREKAIIEERNKCMETGICIILSLQYATILLPVLETQLIQKYGLDPLLVCRLMQAM